MKKLKIGIGIASLLLILLMGIGILWNYSGLKKIEDSSIQDKNTMTYTKDAEKPVAGESRKKQDPILELTQDHITLETGAIFNPIDYIKIAEDSYGYSIKDKVTVDTKIPTDKKGMYEVEYSLLIGDKNITKKKLIVEVKDMNDSSK